MRPDVMMYRGQGLSAKKRGQLQFEIQESAGRFHNVKIARAHATNIWGRLIRGDAVAIVVDQGECGHDKFSVVFELDNAAIPPVVHVHHFAGSLKAWRAELADWRHFCCELYKIDGFQIRWAGSRAWRRLLLASGLYLNPRKTEGI